MKITPKEALAIANDASASPAVRAIAKAVLAVNAMGEDLHKRMLATVEEGQKTQKELARSKHELVALTRVLGDAVAAEMKAKESKAAHVEDFPDACCHGVDDGAPCAHHDDDRPDDDDSGSEI